MFPTGSPSSTPMVADFVGPDDADRSLLIDYERGGIDINDASHGLNYADWKCWLDIPGGNLIKIARVDGSLETTMFSGPVTELTFCFDQNMRPVLAYVVSGSVYLSYFDAVANQTIELGFIGATSPFLSTDDKRDQEISHSDVIFCCVRAQHLRYYVQRERFLIEHDAGAVPVGLTRIQGIGMNKGNRFQIYATTES